MTDDTMFDRISRKIHSGHWRGDPDQCIAEDVLQELLKPTAEMTQAVLADVGNDCPLCGEGYPSPTSPGEVADLFSTMIRKVLEDK